MKNYIRSECDRQLENVETFQKPKRECFFLSDEEILLCPDCYNSKCESLDFFRTEIDEENNLKGDGNGS